MTVKVYHGPTVRYDSGPKKRETKDRRRSQVSKGVSGVRSRRFLSVVGPLRVFRLFDFEYLS